MTALVVIGCILVALVLLSLVRVGGIAEYSVDGLTAKAKIGPFRVTLYPATVKEKKKKRKKKKEAGEKKLEEAPARPGGSLEMLRGYLPMLTDAAGRLRRKIRVDKVYLDFIAAATDPAMAAMEYGYANTVVGMIWPLLENNFIIKDRRIRTAVSFTAVKPTVYVYAALSLTIGQAAALGLRLAAQFLNISSRMKAKQNKEKEAV